MEAAPTVAGPAWKRTGQTDFNFDGVDHLLVLHFAKELVVGLRAVLGVRIHDVVAPGRFVLDGIMTGTEIVRDLVGGHETRLKLWLSRAEVERRVEGRIQRIFDIRRLVTRARRGPVGITYQPSKRSANQERGNGSVRATHGTRRA